MRINCDAIFATIREPFRRRRARRAEWHDFFAVRPRKGDDGYCYFFLTLQRRKKKCTWDGGYFYIWEYRMVPKR